MAKVEKWWMITNAGVQRIEGSRPLAYNSPTKAERRKQDHESVSPVYLVPAEKWEEVVKLLRIALDATCGCMGSDYDTRITTFLDELDKAGPPR